MMARPVAWLTLILALAGPLASQARVADGLAHALAARMVFVVLESPAEHQDEHEACDDLGIVAMTADHDRPDGFLAYPASWVMAPAFLLSFSLSPGHSDAAWPRRWRPPWPPPGAERRQALLQVFLF
jgi:hypothetical protein